MKAFTSSLAVIAVAIAAAHAAAAPQVAQQTATLNAAAAQAHHIENLKKYGGPKANPGVVRVGGASANAAMVDEYCGTGKRPIPVGPNVGGANLGNRGGLAFDDVEPCGTKVPGRIPGGFPGGPGPR